MKIQVSAPSTPAIIISAVRPAFNFLKSHWHAVMFSVLALLGACSPSEKKLSEGIWRGVFAENGREIPFNFSIHYLGSKPVLTYRNAEEHFVSDSVVISGDSLIFPVEVYDAQLVVYPNHNKLTGFWVRNSDPGRKLRFEAHPDEAYRFWIADQLSTSEYVPSGNWEVKLVNADGSESAGVAVFQTESDRVTGTILTSTGDYRFLEGQLSDKYLRLSSFSGGAASLLDLQFESADSLVGTFGGIFNARRFHAKRTDEASLPDAYSLTYLKDGYERLDFAFPNLDGDLVSLTDEKYQDKVKIVTLMGTWCPNCMDEAAFLGPWYEQNKDRGLEVIALSFEQKDDLEYARSRFQKFSKRFGVGYDVLFAGKADKKTASEKLSALNAVFSFPTTIFIDKLGKVRKIHTGFTGPATGVHFDQFKEEFNSIVDLLVSE
jgi:thiol-disulfide isomerase/thioredoxin